MSDHTGRIVDYTYDDLNRLTQEQVTDAINGDRTTSWTYDNLGNRLTQNVDSDLTTYTYDNNDRITEEAGADTTWYTYDANGNTLAKANSSNTTHYGYDSQNHVISAIDAFNALGFE